MPRISPDLYAMTLAYVASLRSEDPYRKVGAVALGPRRYVLGLAYNGLKSGLKVKPSFWHDRDRRRSLVIHAEQNLCALFHRDEVHTVAVTTQPCESCANLLVAHGVRRVLFGETYPGASLDIFKRSHIEVGFIPLYRVQDELARRLLCHGRPLRLHLRPTCERNRKGSRVK